jgi:hypothetical protein
MDIGRERASGWGSVVPKITAWKCAAGFVVRVGVLRLRGAIRFALGSAALRMTIGFLMALMAA